MNAIELRQVSFSYDGKTKILENTDFTAEYGEVTLLSGHSGEGKSTLMYIVSGIIPNVNYGELTGEVKIAGEDIKSKKLGYVCRKVGVVLQNADEQIIQKIVEDEIAFGCENLAYKVEVSHAVRRAETAADYGKHARYGAEDHHSRRAARKSR